MEEGGALGTRQRVANDLLEPAPVDLAHRGDGEAELADELLLAGVERADADERDALGVERRAAARRRSVKPSGDDRAPRPAACRARCRSVTSRACSGRRAHRTRYRPRPVADAMPPSVPSATSGRRRGRAAGTPSRDAVATRAATRSHVSLISAEEASPFGRPVAVASERGRDVAPVGAVETELGDPLAEPRVADGRGPMSTPRRPAPRSSAAPMTATAAPAQAPSRPSGAAGRPTLPATAAR